MRLATDQLAMLRAWKSEQGALSDPAVQAEHFVAYKVAEAARVAQSIWDQKVAYLREISDGNEHFGPLAIEPGAIFAHCAGHPSYGDEARSNFCKKHARLTIDMFEAEANFPQSARLHPTCKQIRDLFLPVARARDNETALAMLEDRLMVLNAQTREAVIWGNASVRCAFAREKGGQAFSKLSAMLVMLASTRTTIKDDLLYMVDAGLGVAPDSVIATHVREIVAELDKAQEHSVPLDEGSLPSLAPVD
ncbi:MAG: hypothetical protein AAGA12_07835 [Pseudomonadota bacterium]